MTRNCASNRPLRGFVSGLRRQRLVLASLPSAPCRRTSSSNCCSTPSIWARVSGGADAAASADAGPRTESEPRPGKRPPAPPDLSWPEFRSRLALAAIYAPGLIFGHANFFRGAAGGVKLPSACCSRI